MREKKKGSFRALSILLMTVAYCIAIPAESQDVCSCEDVSDRACVRGATGNGFQGFEISLVSFEIDQQAGMSEWVYEICDLGPADPDCPSDKELSHIDLLLGDLSTCLSPGSDISFEKIADSAGDGADLSCGVEEGDPSCDPNPGGTVAKCDVLDTNPLSPGDCVQMLLSIAGETVQLGVGAISTQSKAGPECTPGSCILGPSCDPCDGPPPEDACLTRTPGFWGTHPHITELFLPLDVCGETLTQTAAGSCDSSTEALCVSPGRESKKNRAYAQLVRQLTAAILNVAASEANGGFCNAESQALITDCQALCDADHRTISSSGCIEQLAGFNESQDTMETTPPPFDRPGPAQPGACREANGNGIVIGHGDCM